jgi:hypothetical protein
VLCWSASLAWQQPTRPPQASVAPARMRIRKPNAPARLTKGSGVFTESSEATGSRTALHAAKLPHERSCWGKPQRLPFLTTIEVRLSVGHAARRLPFLLVLSSLLSVLNNGCCRMTPCFRCGCGQFEGGAHTSLLPWNSKLPVRLHT